VIGRHYVKDKDHCLTSSERKEVYGPSALPTSGRSVDPRNPTQVACKWTFPDMDILMAAMRSGAIACDEVLGETLVMFVEA